MPFLQCAVSPDGKHVAVRRGAAVTLHAADGGAVLAEGMLVYEDSTLVFAGGALVEHAVDDGRTILTGFSFAKLARVSSCEIAIETRLVAETGKFLLLAFRDTAHVVNVQPTVISYGEMRAAGKVRWAIGAEQDELLVASSRGLEMWNAPSRRPVRRVHLELPESPPAIGPATQRRTLWHTVASGAEIRTFRLSDGKAGLIRLPSVPIDAVGHPASSWLVADLDGKPHAINLVTADLQPLPTGISRSRALVPRGTAAVLVQLDAEAALEWWELGAPHVEGARGLTIDLGAAAAAVTAKPAPVAAAPQPARATALPPPVTTRRDLSLAPAAAGRRVLRPEVVLSLDGGPLGDEPASVGLHVPRDVEHALQALAQRIRLAWLDRVVADSVSERPPSREALQRLVGAETRHGLLLEAGAIVELDPSGRIQPKRPLFADRPVSAWSILRFTLDRELATPLRTGSRGFDLGIDARSLPQIGMVLGMSGELTELGGDAPWATRAAGVLAAMDLLSIDPMRPTLEGQLEAGTVATLGGHTLLANLGGAHVLVDPRLRAASRLDTVPMPVAADLPLLAGVFLTSDDPACLDPATLLTLDKRPPIYVPASLDPSEPVPRAHAVLRLLGFTDVRVVQPGDAIELGGGGRVIALAVADPPPQQVARCAYALCHADACSLATGTLIVDDESVAALAAIGDELARRAGPVSPLFVDIPRRPFAPIERGWRWIFDPVETWLEPRPRRPADLAAIAQVSGEPSVIVYGDHAVTPAAAGSAARRAETYDRFRIGGQQDGWLAPRAW